MSKRVPCETCLATAECSGYRRLVCRWCEEGRPPYRPVAREAQIELNLGAERNLLLPPRVDPST